MSENDHPDVVDAEIVPDPQAALPSDTEAQPDYSTDGVPSFDHVRDRIENRYTTSLGSTELAGLGTDQTVESLDKKLADREQAGRDRLAAIREAMRKD